MLGQINLNLPRTLPCLWFDHPSCYETQHSTTTSVEWSKHQVIGSNIPLKEEQSTQGSVSMAHWIFFHVTAEYNDEFHSTSDRCKNSKSLNHFINMHLKILYKRKIKYRHCQTVEKSKLFSLKKLLLFDVQMLHCSNSVLSNRVKLGCNVHWGHNTPLRSHFSG